MNDVCAVVTDLDGTVLDEVRRVSPRTLDAAAQLATHELPLVLATDRSPAWVSTLESLLQFVSVAVCCGGAVAWRPARAELLWREAIPRESIEEIVQFVADHLPGAGVSVYDGERSLVTDAYAKHGPRRPGPRAIVKLGELVAHPACALSVCSKPSSEGERPSAWPNGQELPVAISHWTGSGVLDIGPPGVDKGTGVRRVLGELGLDPARAIAFGDMPNDLPMFSLCGRSIAVANAHADVIAAATSVAECVHDDGFARALGRLGLVDAGYASEGSGSQRCSCEGRGGRG